MGGVNGKGAFFEVKRHVKNLGLDSNSFKIQPTFAAFPYVIDVNKKISLVDSC